VRPAAALGVAIVLAIAAYGAWRWWDSPERKIRRTLAQLADVLTHDRPAAGLAAVTAAAAVRSYVTEDVVVDAGGRWPSLNGRDAVVAAAARLRTAAPALEVEFSDVRIELGGNDTAAVRCTATAHAVNSAGERTTDAREILLRMRQREGRWLIERAQAVQVMEPLS
jgi:ketosteroid isomerase-like protein